MVAIRPKDMAKMIDYTVIAPDVNVKAVKNKCQDAIKHDFASVSVNSSFIPLVARILKGSSVKVCSMIDYPLGSSTSETKAFETKDAIKNGAQEIDMVVNLSAIKDKNWKYLREDIKAVFDATKIAGVTRDIITKVVFNGHLLTNEEIEQTCKIAKDVGVDFIKNKVLLTEEEKEAGENKVNLIRKRVGRGVGVEAFGKIETFEEAIDVLDAGANRIGTEHGIKIVTDDN